MPTQQLLLLGLTATIAMIGLSVHVLARTLALDEKEQVFKQAWARLLAAHLASMIVFGVLVAGFLLGTVSMTAAGSWRMASYDELTRYLAGRAIYIPWLWGAVLVLAGVMLWALEIILETAWRLAAYVNWERLVATQLLGLALHGASFLAGITPELTLMQIAFGQAAVLTVTLGLGAAAAVN